MQPAPQHAFGQGFNAHGYGLNGGPSAGMGRGSGMGGASGEGEKNVAEMIVDSGNKYMRGCVSRVGASPKGPWVGFGRTLMPAARHSFQSLLDRSTPMTVQRWGATGFLWIVFALVVVIRQGVSGRRAPCAERGPADERASTCDSGTSVRLAKGRVCWRWTDPLQ